MRPFGACPNGRTALVTGGVIVNVASMLSFSGDGIAPGYALSMGGVAPPSKSLAIA